VLARLGLVRGRALVKSGRVLHPLAKILLYVAVVVLAGALLSPPLFWLLDGTINFPFYRYFNRTAQVTAIILLVPLLFWLNIRKVSEIGLEKNSRGWRDAGAGVGLGLVPVALLGLGYLWWGVYRWNPEIEPLKIFRILGTAVVVSIVEEFLFRGVALGLAARSFGRWAAAVAVSLLFAAAHFLKPVKEPDAVVYWWTGFAQLPRILEAAPPPVLFAFGFASLFVAGMVLALAALRTRSLWLPIGIHAGWILGQQGFQWLARPVEKSFASFLPWAGPNVVSGAVPTGIVPLIVLLLTGAAVWLYLRYACSPAPRPS
jgi:membrane protease YdiL (CAAX protease family)